jgi:AcrR family transcriptional regulator
MPTEALSEARLALVRDRAMEGIADLLAQGEDLTFAKVAEAAGVPERTLYRHFATKEVLLAAVYDWANRRIGFDGNPPTDGAGSIELVRRVFPGFDDLAPVVRELLLSPEGHAARLANAEERREASLAVVREAAPALDGASARRVAAVVQLLMSAATWQTLRDYWEMDGTEAAEASALAIELLLDGVGDRGGRK